MAIVFTLFLLIFLFVGLYSVKFKRATSEDYYLAGRQVSPWLISISSAATLYSGFQFTGVMAFTYHMGVSAIWFTIGSFVGQYVVWKWIYKPLRKRNEKIKARTASEFVAYREEGTHRTLVVVGGILTFAFLSIYAAAQLTAGSKALHVVFGWDYWVGGVMSFFIIGAYCLAGGLRASIWTDAIQSVVMIVAMYLLLFYGLYLVGGFSGLWDKLHQIDPNLLDIYPDNLAFGFIPFFLAWICFGIAFLGNPHILVRNLAIESADGIDKARTIFYAWAIPFKLAGFFVGLLCRVLLSPETGFDAELSLLMLSEQILPIALTGIILAGLFASTISTADSQVLACAAAITCDCFPKLSKSYRNVKIGTMGVLLFVLLVMFLAPKNVFELVVLALSSLGVTFVPGLIAQTFRFKVSPKSLITAMITGNATLLFWKYGLGLSSDIKEILPGMLVATGTLWVMNFNFLNKRSRLN